MELRFLSPGLRHLDMAGSEVLACGVFSDERPMHGAAGLVDWRLASRLSQYVEAGELTGQLGEVVLIPGKPRIPFEKLLLFGLGPRAEFDTARYQQVIERMLQTLSGLKVRIAVVERPGRHLHLLEPLQAVDLLLSAAEAYDDQDIWTLVEEPQDHKRIAQHMVEERRRRRTP